MKRFIIFLCVFSWSSYSQGQKKLLDSLHTFRLRIERQTKPEYDTTYINLLYEIAKAYRYTELDSMLYYAHKNLPLAQNIGYTKKQPKILRQIATYYFEKEDYKKSIYYNNKGLQIAERTQDKEDLAFACYNMSLSYNLLEEYTRSLDLSLRALKLFEEVVKTNKGMTAWLAHTHTSIANTYKSQNEWEKSLQHHHQSIELSNAIHYSYGVVISYSNISYIYIKQKKYQQAFDAIAKSNKLLALMDLPPIDNDYILSHNLFNMGIGYREQGMLKEALDNIKQAHQISIKYQNELNQAEFGSELIITYFKLKQYDKVIEHGLPLLAIAQRLGLKLEIKSMAETLTDTYQVMADYEKAFFYQKLCMIYKDSLFNDESREKIIQVEYQYKYEKKEAILKEQQKAEIETAKKIAEARSNTFNILSISFIVFVITIAYLIYRSRQVHKRLNVLLTKKNDVLKQQKQELQAINQTKDKLFSIIGHDLRSPMNSLTGLFDLLKEGGVSSEEFDMLIPKLQNSVKNISFTLDNLLFWAKNQMQGVKTNPQEVDIHTIVENNLNLFREVAQAKDISLKSSIQAHTTVWADPNQIDLVFRNLINNALKFTYTKGEINLKTNRENDYWIFSVVDTGRGMNKEHLSRLFQKNNYISTRGTSGEKGTGLGLVLCQEMIEKNGGEIQVVSEEGKGSTFYFSLPAR